jgi:heptaprenyl diphosphate synthase
VGLRPTPIAARELALARSAQKHSLHSHFCARVSLTVVPSQNPLLAVPGLADQLQRVEDALAEAVAAEDDLMREMGGHLIVAGGKRGRPLLALAAAGCLADDTDAAIAAMTDDVVQGGAAVELVQVGSLCHDDVIDEAETRRGAESVNARWGNLKAILAGDFLLARASDIAARLGTEVAGLLAATIGRLCEGEVVELQHAFQVDRTEEAYMRAIEGKTAALFATSARIGGIVGDLPRDRIDDLTAFGLCYGLAFQVIDDVLDLVSTSEELGKPAGHDIAEGIYNLPVLRALQTDVGSELRELLGGPLEDGAVDQVIALVRRSGGVDEAIEVARGFVDEAVTALAPFGERPLPVALAEAARHLLTGF